MKSLIKIIFLGIVIFLGITILKNHQRNSEYSMGYHKVIHDNDRKVQTIESDADYKRSQTEAEDKRIQEENSRSNKEGMDEYNNNTKNNPVYTSPGDHIYKCKYCGREFKRNDGWDHLNDKCYQYKAGQPDYCSQRCCDEAN